MKASELIRQLYLCIEKNGDLPVCTYVKLSKAANPQRRYIESAIAADMKLPKDVDPSQTRIHREIVLS